MHLKNLKQVLHNKGIDCWYSCINSIFKYLNINPDPEIEKGSYKNIPADKRFCKLCNKNVIEDEIHFLLQCPSLIQERSTFVSDLSSRW